MATPSANHDGTYPYAVMQMPSNWAAGAMQWAAIITAASRENLERKLREDVALHLLYAALDGEFVPPPLKRSELDLTDYEEFADGEPYEVIYAEPASLSAWAVAILRAMQFRGVAKTELASLMGVTPAVVSRLTNPFYFRHSSASIRRVAEVLNMQVDVRLVKPGTRPEESDAFARLPLL